MDYRIKRWEQLKRECDLIILDDLRFNKRQAFFHKTAKDLCGTVLKNPKFEDDGAVIIKHEGETYTIYKEWCLPVKNKKNNLIKKIKEVVDTFEIKFDGNGIVYLFLYEARLPISINVDNGLILVKCYEYEHDIDIEMINKLQIIFKLLSDNIEEIGQWL